MLLRNFSSSLLASAFLAGATLLASGQVNAQVGLQGSGTWGGTQGCSTQTRVGNNAISVSDEEKEAKKEVAKANLELDLLKRDVEKSESYLKRYDKKIRSYFDSEIADFLIDEHFTGTKLCEDYKSYPAYDCPGPKTKAQRIQDEKDAAERRKKIASGEIAKGEADAAGTPVPDICNHKTKVPSRLWSNWTSGTKYCEADEDSDKGKVSSEICSDVTLFPEGGKSKLVSASECASSLKEYRSYRIKLENASAKVARAEQAIQEREERIADEKERAAIEKKYSQKKTEAQAPCAECDGQTTSSNKSYLLSAAQVAAGIGFGLIGKKYDERNASYQAQLGYPPTEGSTTAVSFGFPYILAGAYGALTGGSATGSFGCGSGVNGTGSGNIYGGGNNAYGPFANNGGAFGYPQNYYGSPWGGGAYNPGYNPYGNFNGPNGGLAGNLNGQYGVGSPLNGLLGSAGVGTAFNGSYANGAYQNGSYMGGGYLSGQIGALANGGAYMNGSYMGGNYMAGGNYMNGNYANGAYGTFVNGQIGALANAGTYMNGNQGQQYALQQQQAQLQAQMQQAQAQYYQAQVQAQQQQQAYQRQIMVTQQAGQITQQIQVLQQNLQSLYSSSGYLGTSNSYLGGSAGISGGFSLGIGTNYGTYGSGIGTTGVGVGSAFSNSYNLNTNTGTSATVPGIGNGVRIGR